VDLPPTSAVNDDSSVVALARQPQQTRTSRLNERRGGEPRLHLASVMGERETVARPLKTLVPRPLVKHHRASASARPFSEREPFKPTRTGPAGPMVKRLSRVLLAALRTVPRCVFVGRVGGLLPSTPDPPGFTVMKKSPRPGKADRSDESLPDSPRRQPSPQHVRACPEARTLLS